MIQFAILAAVMPLAWWWFGDVVLTTTDRLMGWFSFGIALAVTLWLIDEGVKLAFAKFDESDG